MHHAPTESLGSSVLVLNRHYIPVDTTAARDAVVMLYKGTAKAVNKDYQAFTFEQWVDYSTYCEGQKIHSPSISILIPDTILVPSYSDYPIHNIILRYSRRNVFLRDNMKCQYCGERGTYDSLTIDHIVPKSKGGPNTYENVVSACKACNNQKRDRTPEESGMIPMTVPTTPSWYSKVRNNPTWLKFFKTLTEQ